MFCRHSRETGERIEVAIPSETKIFDLVDEKEYARIVRKRQAESWIMGDGVCIAACSRLYIV